MNLPIDTAAIAAIIKDEIRADEFEMRVVTHRPAEMAAKELERIYSVHADRSLSGRVMEHVLSRIDWHALVAELDAEDTAERARAA